MADKPIIFSGPMVRALLDGRKTQTRRLVKSRGGVSVCDGSAVLPYAPGDRLYVREAIHRGSRQGLPVCYRADWDDGMEGPWRSSIHMPRWASRLTLTVTEVRVERLQEISEADAKAEGAPALGAELCPPDCEDIRSHVWGFHDLWNSLHGPDAWDANPWVIAVSFTVRRGNIDQIGGANA